MASLGAGLYIFGGGAKSGNEVYVGSISMGVFVIAIRRLVREKAGNQGNDKV